MSGVVSVNGIPASQVRLIVPHTGVWSAEVLFPEPPNLVGPVVLAIDESTWVGTVAPEQSGTYATESHLTIVGGRGGWRRILGPKHEHNDGVFTRARLAQNVALEATETIAVDPSVDLPVGVDWVRRAGEASRVLEQLFPDVPWYVDAAGVTQVGRRLPRDVTALVNVLEVDSVQRTAELGIESVLDVLPGASFVDQRFGDGAAPFVIHDLELHVDADKVRALVSASDDRDSEILALLRRLVERSLPRRDFYGLYRYRVLSVEADGRMQLQVRSRLLGLPDLVAISVAPGLGGSSSAFVAGAEVLVQFIEGDPAQPIVSHMPAKRDPFFLPLSTTIDATLRVKIGDEEPCVPFVAIAEKRFPRYGDTITIPGIGPVPLVPDPSSPTMGKAGGITP